MSGEVTERCSDAARRRGDPMLATAPPARRLLLIEVPGPWGAAGLSATRLPHDVSGPLAAGADAAGVRVQLIRRPGRHAVSRDAEAMRAEGHRWALADPDLEIVRWGRWREPGELLEIALDEALDRSVAVRSGPQRVALVCTHAKRDVCCALRGRPVAAGVAAAVDREVWETSHLGGDRFAANLLLLPEGEVFGELDEVSSVEVALRLDAGRLTLAHYRGRAGRPPVVQAALHLAAVHLDDDRRGAVRLAGPAQQHGDEWEVMVVHHGRRYRIRLQESWSEPERLSCAAIIAKPARRFAVLSMDEQGVRRAG